MASRCFPLPTDSHTQAAQEHKKTLPLDHEKLGGLFNKNHKLYCQNDQFGGLSGNIFAGLSGSIFHYIKNKTFLSKANSTKVHQYCT